MSGRVELLRRFIGRKLLLVGEAGSGKTLLLARLLDYLADIGLGGKVTVIDMAPPKAGEIGGTLDTYTDNVRKVRYLKPPKIIPPRLTGRSAEEVKRYAQQNHEILKPLIEEYLMKPTRILLVNDVTIYLHWGDFEDLKRAISVSETFVGTAYQGVKLQDDKGSGITEAERDRLEELKQYVDEVMVLS